MAWLIGGTAVIFAAEGGRWRGEEWAAWLAFVAGPSLLLVGWMWVKRGKQN